MLPKSIRSLPLMFMAALVCGSANGQLPGNETFATKDEVTNAALIYWQAFEFLPGPKEEYEQVLTDFEDGSTDLIEAEPLVASSKTALDAVSVLKLDTPCRWQLLEMDGAPVMTHLGKARFLARLLTLQARLDAMSGKPDAAVDHLAQALLVARHVVDEGILLEVVVSDIIEEVVVEAAESVILELDDSSRARFATSLAKLPPRPTFDSGLTNELDEPMAEIRSIVTAEREKQRAVLTSPWVYREDSPELKTILSGSREERAQRFKELLATYDKLIEACKLSPSEAGKQLLQLEAKIEDSPNPLLQWIPSISSSYKRHSEVDARMAKLRVALQDNGQSTDK